MRVSASRVGTRWLLLGLLPRWATATRTPSASRLPARQSVAEWARSKRLFDMADFLFLAVDLAVAAGLAAMAAELSSWLGSWATTAALRLRQQLLPPPTTPVLSPS